MTSYDSPAEVTPQEVYDLYSEDAAKGYLSFLKHVMVDAQPTKKVFRLIAENWQWEREHRCAAAIDQLAGISTSCVGPLSFWNGYAKGHDKTHAIARKLCFLLGWSKKRLTLYAMAGDKDQAGLITLAMRGVVADNPWIAQKVEVMDKKARGSSGSELEIMALDAWTGQGIFPDYMVADELSHWQHDRARQFWNFILSSQNKRPQCVLDVCTNAGYKGSFQWDERNRVIDSKFWKFFEQAESTYPYTALASWMNQEKIAEDSKGMDRGEADRLHGNRWIDPGEERGYLTLAEAEACVNRELLEQVQGDRRIGYYAVIDYGGVSDRCGLGVLHNVPGTNRVVVDRLDCWQGAHDSRILIDDPGQDARSVEGWIELTRRSFPLVALILDPYQLESLAQKYERRNVRVLRFEFRAGKNNYRMAQVLKHAVQNKLVTWSPEAGRLPPIGPNGKRIEDETLALELARLVKVPMSYGYRFDHESGRHDDRANVVGMGLLHCLPEIAPASTGPKIVQPQVAHVRHSPVPVVVTGRDPAVSNNLFGMGRNERR